MKQLIIITLLTVLGGLPQAKAQGRVAYVHLDTILLAHPDYSELMTQWDSLKTEYTRDLAGEKEKLQQKNTAFLNKYQLKGGETWEDLNQIMSPADSMVFQVLLDDNTALQNKEKSFNNILNFVFNRDIKPILKEVNSLIEVYAREHEIDVVFMAKQIQGTYIYLNPEQNITRLIVEQLTE